MNPCEWLGDICLDSPVIAAPGIKARLVSGKSALPLIRRRAGAVVYEKLERTELLWLRRKE